MAHFLKELVVDFLKSPLSCYRQLRCDRQQAQFWQTVHRNGGTIHVYPANIQGDFLIDVRSHVALQVLEQGIYEEEITHHMNQLSLNQQGAVVNVGANVGLMTVFLARKFGRKTIAVEPNPEAFELLQKNVSLNGLGERVTCIQACIGAEPGNVEFSFVRGKPEYSSMGGIVHPCVSAEAREVLCVPVKPLSHVITEPVAFMLIDTEGAEELVFKGAQEIIQRDHPVIMCECTDVLLPKFGTSASNVISWLIGQGYQVRDMATDAILDDHVQPGFSSNIVALYRA